MRADRIRPEGSAKAHKRAMSIARLSRQRHGPRRRDRAPRARRRGRGVARRRERAGRPQPRPRPPARCPRASGRARASGTCWPRPAFASDRSRWPTTTRASARSTAACSTPSGDGGELSATRRHERIERARGAAGGSRAGCSAAPPRRTRRRAAVRDRRLARGVRDGLALPAERGLGAAARRRARAGRDAPVRRAAPRRARDRSAIRAVVDVALADPPCDGRVGLWGNSAGGWLAVLTAAATRGSRACCVTAAPTARPRSSTAIPRFVAELQQHDRARRPRRRARRLRRARRSTPTSCAPCAARCTSSTARRTRSSAWTARAASTRAPRASDKTLSEFADGDHCVSNRSHEKHMLIADWFADRLSPRR